MARHTQRVSERSEEERDRRIAEQCVSYQRGLAAQQAIAARQWASERDLHGLEALASVGKRASAALVRENFGLIVSLSRLATGEIVSGRVSNDDLLQLAVLGFLRGAALFDPARGTKISTFCQHYVRESIRTAFRDSIGLSGVHGGDLAVSLRRWLDLFEDSSGHVDAAAVAEAWNQATVSRHAALLQARFPDRYDGQPEEWAFSDAEQRVRHRGLWLDETRVVEILRRSTPVRSLNGADAVTDDDVRLEERIAGDSSPEDILIDHVERAERDTRIKAALSQWLTDLEAAIVLLYFGFEDGEAKSADEVAHLLDLRPADVHRHLENALVVLNTNPDLREIAGLGRPPGVGPTTAGDRRAER